MAAFTVRRGDVFRAGESVGAYKAASVPLSGAGVPSGPAVEVAVADADGTVVFSTLEDETAYVAYAPAPSRGVRFTTAPAQAVSPGGITVSDVVQQFCIDGAVAVGAGAHSFRLPFDMNLVSLSATIGTAPAGQALMLDVNRNGISVFTSSAHRPSIPAGNTLSSVIVPDLPGIAEGDLVTVDVDQVGSATAGSDLTVTLYLQRTFIPPAPTPPPVVSPTPPAALANPFVLDTFVGPNGTLLPDHVGEIGAGWSSITNFGDALTIGGNAVYGAGAANFAAGMPTGTPTGGTHDYTVRALVAVRSLLSGSYAQVLGRQHISQDTAYQLTLTAANQLILQSKVTATTIQIGSYDLVGAELLVEGQLRTIDLVMTGTTIKGKLDGVEKISVASSSITGVASDHVGMRLRNSAATTGLLIDTFSAA